MRASIHAFIEQRLADPGLGPDMIAAAHHISRRYLYQVFGTEAHGAGVAAWIRQRRVERCQSDLLDPALASRPVSAIAARWGFADAASFSRTFRAALRVPPARYRALHSKG
jgi:transcriptional regulator GlxA family with amidase domain